VLEHARNHHSVHWLGRFYQYEALLNHVIFSKEAIDDQFRNLYISLETDKREEKEVYGGENICWPALNK
jgi:hypothetical protein